MVNSRYFLNISRYTTYMISIFIVTNAPDHKDKIIVLFPSISTC
jgi:hypothetical protein